MAEDVDHLVCRAATGDRAAWSALIERYGKLVWHVTGQFGLTDADRQDVSQLAWLRLAEKAHTLRHPGSVSSWLISTTRHECLRLISARRREQVVGWLDDPVDDEPGPQARAVRADTESRLWEAFASLPQRCQLLLRLRAFVPEMRYVQLARAVGLSLNSVARTRARCLRELRRTLESSGIDGEVA